MTLYSCKHDGQEYRITKFDDDLNVESSYLCTELECECPAGVRPICRHREMLPKFIERKTVGTDWWFDYDRGGWVQMGNGDGSVDLPKEDEYLKGIMEQEGPHSQAVTTAGFDSAGGGSIPPVAARPLPPAHYPGWRRI